MQQQKDTTFATIDGEENGRGKATEKLKLH